MSCHSDTAALRERLLDRADFEDKRAIEQATRDGLIVEHSNGSHTGALLREASARIAELEAALAQPDAQGAVAWMLRDSRTGEVYWDAEMCVWNDASSANDCADDMNENIEDASFEVFPVYAHPSPNAEALLRLADETDHEAAISARAGQCARLAAIANKLRALAKGADAKCVADDDDFVALFRNSLSKWHKGGAP